MMRLEWGCIRECGGLFSPITIFFPARKLLDLGCTLVFSEQVCATEVRVLEGVCTDCS